MNEAMLLKALVLQARGNEGRKELKIKNALIKKFLIFNFYLITPLQTFRRNVSPPMPLLLYN